MTATNGHAGKPEWTLAPTIIEEIDGLTANGWKPKAGDALHECTFGKSGFRAYELVSADKTWSLALSQVDVSKSDPRGLLSVYAPGHDAAFGDLNDLVMTRSVSLQGSQSVGSISKMLSETLGGNKLDWQRRVDYLVARTTRLAQTSNQETLSINNGRPERPKASPFVFQWKAREGRVISLFGAASAGKTTIADGLVASLCSGLEIIPGWKPTRKYRVGVLDWDEGQTEFETRLSAICAAYDINLEHWRYLRMSRPLVDTADETGRWVAANEIEVLFVSPVEAAARTDQNYNSPIHGLYEVLREFGTTSFLIDHVAGDNIKKQADREIGGVAKQNNQRAGYLVKEQSQEPGSRVVAVYNKKPDALMPKQSAQAIRVEYAPEWPYEDGTYDRISFHPDVILEPDSNGVLGTPMRQILYQALMGGTHKTIETLADENALNRGSVKACLNRYKGKMFGTLPSGAWEALPQRESSTVAVLP